MLSNGGVQVTTFDRVTWKSQNPKLKLKPKPELNPNLKQISNMRWDEKP